MNKNQGIGTGLFLAVAALMLRPTSPNSPPETQISTPAVAETVPPARIEAREGPWIASCNYWAPVRPAAPQPSRDPEISGTIDNKRIEMHLDLPESSKGERGCVPDKTTDQWGFPGDLAAIHVTALIALVPDPVHTHLAFTFDRTMDAVLQAGADNGYVPGYFWIPWKVHGSSLRMAESSSDTEPGHDPDRERQPGLIILKNAYRFDQVIYLFLVGETATEGVDGMQLQNAFSYESKLKTALGSHFSTGDSPGKKEARVAIVGPTFSGSAASLRAAIDAAKGSSGLDVDEFHVTGVTYASFPVQLLTRNGKSTPAPPPAISYNSFGYDSDYTNRQFLQSLEEAGYDLARVALLVEDNTAYASFSISESEKDRDSSKPRPVTIRFPREISSLRNAQSVADRTGTVLPDAISPYLHFSVKDFSSPRDSISVFSREITPLSQEAQLMTIARQLHRNRTEFVLLSASNPLDLIFLAQFLHRACPETTLVFSGDLLTVREIDSVPFVGSVSITPYPLFGLGRSVQPGRPVRTYPSSSSYAYYNAVSYSLWESGLHQPEDKLPVLAAYRNLLKPDAIQPPLWATAVGNDGYYPLGILSPCSSNHNGILPRIEDKDRDKIGEPRNQGEKPDVCNASSVAIPQVTIYPSRLWDFYCVVITLLCLFHALMLQAADYSSPFSRDLAVKENDQPRRRTFYIRVATAMLVAMAFAVSFPVLWLHFRAGGNPLSTTAGAVALIGAFLAVLSTHFKTREYVRWQGPLLWPAEGIIEPTGSGRRRPIVLPGMLTRAYESIRQNFYEFANLALVIALAAILGLWGYSCITGSFEEHSPDLAGLSFCFRAVNPGTGISPLDPILLLLLGWCTWALMQTRRLRFSDAARPKLPKKLDPEANRFFLSDDELAQPHTPAGSCLYRSITCLMITRQIVRRLLFRSSAARVDIGFALAGGLLFAFATLVVRVRYVDHFVWNTGRALPSPYEFLFVGLLATLIAVCLAGWIRMIVIWSALRRAVLERLENLPIRFAFSRIKGIGWMTMLRQGGLEQQWRDLARSLESMCHLSHQPDLPSARQRELGSRCDSLTADIDQFRERIANPTLGSPRPDREEITMVEERIAEFSQFLLSSILIPHWRDERTGLVESKETEPASATEPPLPRIRATEEFLAIRYSSLITAVLVNLRYLMTFVSVSFVLALLAWNSSSFQPRKLLDWCFTFFLAVLGAGVIAVFAQMHRNAILSRITDTRANELGFDFYFRVISFGALPVITWLAYQFPDVGTTIYRFIEPVVPVIK